MFLKHIVTPPGENTTITSASVHAFERGNACPNKLGLGADSHTMEWREIGNKPYCGAITRRNVSLGQKRSD